MLRNALAIVQAATAEAGLPIPASLESTDDPGTVQLLALLNTAGYELCSYYPWSFLNKFHAFNTVIGQAAYAVPADWAYYLDLANWDSTNLRYVAGPVSARQWQPLNSALAPSAYVTSFRVFGGKLNLVPVPSGVVSLSFSYVSNAWVESSLAPGTFIQLVSKNADIPQYDWLLMVKLLKLKFWQAKGLDTTAYQQDFDAYYRGLVGKDVGAPMLSLDGGYSPYRQHYLDACNLPASGYGG